MKTFRSLLIRMADQRRLSISSLPLRIKRVTKIIPLLLQTHSHEINYSQQPKSSGEGNRRKRDAWMRHWEEDDNDRRQ